MYTHFLVPIDDSALSAINVESAVHLAQSLGAKITFFHAAANVGVARQGARLKARDTQGFAEPALGDVYAMLAKASVQATGAGVPCQTCTRADDHPAQAIVQVAREHGCDLVVMATHGTVHYTLSNVSAILNGKLETMTGSFVYNSATNLVTQISFDFAGAAIDSGDDGSLFTMASEPNFGLVNAGVLQGYDVYALNALGSAGAVFLASPLSTLGSIAVQSVQYSSPGGYPCEGGYVCSNFAIAGSFVVGTEIPEPGSLTLAATALIGLGALRGRAGSKASAA